ncbi:MAG: hypothetical protein AB1486_26620 [Planctomycetota bacterium]
MEPLDLGPLTFRGRCFSGVELRLIKELVASSPDEHRFALSKKICHALQWHQHNERLKDRSCRDVLARLEQIGWLELPPPRRPAVRRRAIPLAPETASRPTLRFPA